MSNRLNTPAAWRQNDRQAELRDLISQTRSTLAYGSGRAGKTFEILRCIVVRALKAPGSQHAIMRMRLNHVRASLWPDIFKVCRICFPQVKVDPNKSEMTVTIPTAGEPSVLWFGGLDDKARTDKILGMEFATIFCNETSQMPYESVMTLRTRLAQRAIQFDNGEPLKLREIFDLNPTGTGHWTYKIWFEGVDPQDQKPVDLSAYGKMHFRIEDNTANLAPEVLEIYRALPEIHRKRFYLGEYSAEVPGALWQRDRIMRVYQRPVCVRIVIAVDPAVSSHAGSDETGITVVGITEQGWAVVLADESGRMSVDEWAWKVISLFLEYDADQIVYEENQGKDLVADCINMRKAGLPMTGVHAWRGKFLRAEPVAGAYSNGRVRHFGVFDRLEDEMCAFTPDFDRVAAGYSPDRLDSMVYGVKALLPDLEAKPAARPERKQVVPPHKQKDWRPGGVEY